MRKSHEELGIVGLPVTRYYVIARNQSTRIYDEKFAVLWLTCARAILIGDALRWEPLFDRNAAPLREYTALLQPRR